MLASLARLLGLKPKKRGHKKPKKKAGRIRAALPAVSAPAPKQHAVPVATLEQLRAARAEIILYVSGIEKVAYQANMWIPVLEKLSLRSAIVIREAETAKDLVPTRIPHFFLYSTRDVELLEASGARVILYPANHSKNVQCLRFHRMQHCFINHGESDKVVNQSKFLMAYDHLLVAGPLAEMRLRRAGLPLRSGQVVHVGRPQVELLLDSPRTSAAPIATILYAPTWEGFVEEANYSSVSPYGLAMLDSLLAGTDCKILFKPHPFTGFNEKGDTGLYLEKMRELARKFPDRIELVPVGDGIHLHMNRSDLLVTDVSSVLNDYLYTQKPMVITNPRGLPLRRLHGEYPSSQGAYPLDNPSTASTLIADIRANDRLRAARGRVRDLSLGSYPRGSLARFDEIVTRCAMRWQTYAHRGGAGLRPQNTLAAFAHAIELGCPGAELDVHLTRDGHIVVHHDAKLSWKRTRRPDGRWLSRDDAPLYIGDLTLAELRAYTIGEPNPDAAAQRPGFVPVPDAHIPTLPEVLALVRERSPDFRLVIEFKSPIEDNLDRPWLKLVEAVVSTLRQTDFVPRTAFCSFDWGALIHAKQICPEIPTWFTTHPSAWFADEAPADHGHQVEKLRALHRSGDAPWYAGFDPRRFPGGAPEAVAKAGGDRWFAHHSDFTLERMMACARLGVGNAAWAVKLQDPAELARLRDSGLEILCTDYPEDQRTPEMFVAQD